MRNAILLQPTDLRIQRCYDTINIYDATKIPGKNGHTAADEKTLAETPINRFGVYVQDLIGITPKLNLLAGVRWSYQGSPAATTNYLLYSDSSAKGTTKSRPCVFSTLWVSV
jgi:iron complex outermembrane receptor protein